MDEAISLTKSFYKQKDWIDLMNKLSVMFNNRAGNVFLHMLF